MNIQNIVKIHVSLLEEGAPTWRPTKALDLGNGLYELLPTENYDPEDEIWEFEPRSVVMGQERYTDAKEKILIATRLPVSREEILKSHAGAPVVQIQIHVFLREMGKSTTKQTEAIVLKNGLYKLLPTPDYNPEVDIWEFSPGSVVRTIKEKDEFGNKVLLAFEQIREDRIDEHYARYVTRR